MITENVCDLSIGIYVRLKCGVGDNSDISDLNVFTIEAIYPDDTKHSWTGSYELFESNHCVKAAIPSGLTAGEYTIQARARNTVGTIDIWGNPPETLILIDQGE